MNKLNVGDRVVSTIDHPEGNRGIVVGSAGVVCVIEGRAGVCWDKEIPRGHSLDGRCESGHGWWVDLCDIEPEPDDGVAFEFDEDEFNKLVFGEV